MTFWKTENAAKEKLEKVEIEGKNFKLVVFLFLNLLLKGYSIEFEFHKFIENNKYSIFKLSLDKIIYLLIGIFKFSRKKPIFESSFH